jgi:predicted phosphodiesterase
VNCKIERQQAIKDLIAGNPDLPKRTIARMLFRDHPLLFQSLDAARSLVRYYTGCKGELGRSHAADKSLFREKGKAGDVFMPESIAADWTRFELGEGKILTLSDVHIPFHDPAAFEGCVGYGRKRNPDIVLLNGDWADFYSISHWDRNPSVTSLKKEIDACKAGFEYLRDRFPKARIIYKLGNHDERFDLFLWRRAPELFGLSDVGLDKIMDLNLWGVEMVKDKRIIMAGKLAVVHGHEFPKGISSPVNPARGFFMRGQECTIGGHLHRTSEHTEPTMLGRYITTWSTGALCNLNPQYSPINKWNHGFAYITVDSRGCSASRTSGCGVERSSDEARLLPARHGQRALVSGFWNPIEQGISTALQMQRSPSSVAMESKVAHGTYPVTHSHGRCSRGSDLRKVK